MVARERVGKEIEVGRVEIVWIPAFAGMTE